MKMALSEFALREKGIYGVLHIVILLLSLFLVVSISVDTFKGIPFYTQTVFMKVQFAVCILFLLDFILEKSMEYVNLGKTGLKVSKKCLEGMGISE